jgi:hypothetical protein
MEQTIAKQAVITLKELNPAGDKYVAPTIQDKSAEQLKSAFMLEKYNVTILRKYCSSYGHYMHLNGSRYSQTQAMLCVDRVNEMEKVCEMAVADLDSMRNPGRSE